MVIHRSRPPGFANADDLRAWAVQHRVEPARARGDRRFQIAVRDVADVFGKSGVINSVCSALKAESKFLKPNGLRLVQTDGPPSGVSTTVVYTFEFTDAPFGSVSSGHGLSALLALRGTARAAFAQAGGGERVLADVREGWDQ